MNLMPDASQGAPDTNPSRPPPILEVRTGTGRTPVKEPHDHWELITVRGEIDMGNAGQLVEAIEVAGSVVVDLSGVTFIDSAGLHGLLRAQQAGRRRGDGLILRDPSEAVRRVLERTNMIDVFAVEG
jgi:anti-anti-sigma factor